MRATEWNLTAKDIAIRYNVSLSTVYRLKLKGRIPFLQPGGKRHFVRFPESVLNTPTETTFGAIAEESMTHKPIPGPKPKWLADGERNQ